MQDPDGLNLRYYQIEAIQAAEKAIAEHKQTALLAMATGTGKTRTVLGMIYRFLDAGRFKRILYLCLLYTSTSKMQKSLSFPQCFRISSGR